MSEDGPLYDAVEGASLEELLGQAAGLETIGAGKSVYTSPLYTSG